MKGDNGNYELQSISISLIDVVENEMPFFYEVRYFLGRYIFDEGRTLLPIRLLAMKVLNLT